MQNSTLIFYEHGISSFIKVITLRQHVENVVNVSFKSGAPKLRGHFLD